MVFFLHTIINENANSIDIFVGLNKLKAVFRCYIVCYVYVYI